MADSKPNAGDEAGGAESRETGGTNTQADRDKDGSTSLLDHQRYKRSRTVIEAD